MQVPSYSSINAEIKNKLYSLSNENVQILVLAYLWLQL